MAISSAPSRLSLADRLDLVSREPLALLRRIPPRSRHRIETLVAVAVFALVTLAFFNPVLRTGSTFSLVAGHSTIQFPWAAAPSHYGDAAQSDQANNVYPIQTDLNRQLRHGTFPFWSPYSFGGGPTLGTVYGVGFYPPRVLASLILSPDWVHDVLVMLHVFLAGVAMFLLVRSLGASWIAGLLAGVGWMLSPSWFGLALLEGNTVLAALLPLALWLMHRAVTRDSLADAAWCAVALALIVLGASVQPAVFCFLIVCVWGLLLELGVRRDMPVRLWASTIRRRLWIVIPAGALGAALSAFLVLPETGQISDSGRAVVPSAAMRLQDVDVDNLRHWIDASPPAFITGDNVWTLTFLGLPLGLAALAGLLSRRRGTGLGRMLVVVFFLLMAGTVVTDVARSVIPGFAYLSPLGRLLPFLAFGATILGAIGLDAFRDAMRRWTHPDIRTVVAGGLAAVALIAVPLEAWQLFRYDRDVNPPFQPRRASMLFPTTPLIAALQRSRDETARAGGMQRIIPVRHGTTADPFTPPPFVGETTRLFGLQNVGGYLNVIPKRSRVLALTLAGVPADVASHDLVGAYQAFFYAGSLPATLLPRVGVDRVVTDPAPTSDPTFRRMIRALHARVAYDGPDGRVLAVPSALPRAFVVDGVEVAGSEDAALRRFSDPSFDPRRAVLLDGADARGVEPAPGAGPLQRARVHADGPNGLDVTVDAPRPSWLVVLDSFAKGWSAKIGGRDVPIRRGDFAYRAVRVPAGHSVVHMRYRAPGLLLGLAVSGLAAAATLALLLLPGIRRRGRGPRLRRFQGHGLQATTPTE